MCRRDKQIGDQQIVYTAARATSLSTNGKLSFPGRWLSRHGVRRTLEPVKPLISRSRPSDARRRSRPSISDLTYVWGPPLRTRRVALRSGRSSWRATSSRCGERGRVRSPRTSALTYRRPSLRKILGCCSERTALTSQSNDPQIKVICSFNSMLNITKLSRASRDK